MSAAISIFQSNISYRGFTLFRGAYYLTDKIKTINCSNNI